MSDRPSTLTGKRAWAIAVPSGFQDGYQSKSSGSSVRFVWFAPSASMTQTSPGIPARGSPRVKAMCAPSGDQVGFRSMESSVSSVGLLPSAFMTQMADTFLSLANRVEAIFVPSADQAGPHSSPFGSLVRSTCPLPSAFMAQRSRENSPLGTRAKTIRVPSGDQAGYVSWNVWSFDRSVGWLPSECMAQIWYGGGGGGSTYFVNEMCPLSPDHEGQESSPAASFVRSL